MTLTLPGLLVLLVIAAICGAVGKAIAGGARGGLVVAIALGFIGALARVRGSRRQLGLPSRSCSI